MLSSYQTDLENLLQLPGAPVQLYPLASQTLWINKARGQLAGEGECIRVIGTLPTIIGQRAYNFSSINVGSPATSGVQGIFHVRDVQYAVASGQKRVNNKSWEWFNAYALNNPVPDSGPPTTWAQFLQGASGQGSITGIGTGSLRSGSLYIDPVPDVAYNLLCDCVCYPIALSADTDVEAIPYLWTDAVPYFAAYLALMSAQTGQRLQEAQAMKQLYAEFVQRARSYATPAVDRALYEQVGDVSPINAGGGQGGAGGAAGGLGGGGG